MSVPARSYRTVVSNDHPKLAPAGPVSWREELIKAQRGLCLICDKPIDGEHGSWDHFIPRVLIQGDDGKGTKAGLAFWTHAKCNSKRRHSIPTAETIDRARKALKELPPAARAHAERNIASALQTYVEYVAALAGLKP